MSVVHIDVAMFVQPASNASRDRQRLLLRASNLSKPKAPSQVETRNSGPRNWPKPTGNALTLEFRMHYRRNAVVTVTQSPKPKLRQSRQFSTHDNAWNPGYAASPRNSGVLFLQIGGVIGFGVRGEGSFGYVRWFRFPDRLPPRDLKTLNPSNS